MESNSSKIRKRNPKACRRCHRRKQRCVGYPTCHNCEAANSSCTRVEPTSHQPASERYHGMSKDALFDRIEELEAQLRAVARPAERSPSPGTFKSPVLPSACTSSSSSTQFFNVMNNLVPESVEPQSTALPFFSDALLAQEMDRIFEDSVLKSLAAHTPSMEDDPLESSLQLEITSSSGLTHSEGTRYIKAYLETLHNQLPFLDSVELYRMHDEQSEFSPRTLAARWKFFKLYMVYAIGAATCRISEKSTGVSSKELLRTALQYKSPMTELRSLQSIEAMLLLTLYNCRIPTSSNVWYMIGVAMRTAIDLGLHREAEYVHLGPEDSQRRRRLFWSVYLMDRSIARLLGRPFNIAEHEIDVRLPYDYDEHSSTQHAAQQLFHEQPSSASAKVFLPIIRLVRLKSQIQTRVHRVDKEISLLLPEISPLYSALKEFRNSLNSNLSPIDTDWINMQWHNGIRMLLQPFLSELPANHELIQTCMKASGQMCQFFKGLHQKGYMGFGYILVSLLFKAGLTLCYCLFKSSQPCSISVANDLGACSSVLFAVAGHNQQAQKYRDTWEAVLTKVMEHLDQVSKLNEKRIWSLAQAPFDNAIAAQKAGPQMVSGLLSNCTTGNSDEVDQYLREENSLLYTQQRTIAPSQLFQPPYSEFLSTNDLSDEIQRDAKRRPLGEARDILAFGEMSSDEFVDENRYELRMFDELFSSTIG